MMVDQILIDIDNEANISFDFTNFYPWPYCSKIGLVASCLNYYQFESNEKIVGTTQSCDKKQMSIKLTLENNNYPKN